MDVFSADWLGICRRIVAEQRRIFAATPSSAERTVYVGIGEGGDHTLVIGRVLTASLPSPDGGPLTYFRGRYRQLR